MPSWSRSIRLRLALLYSTVLLALTVLLLGSLYLALSLSLRNEPVSRDTQAQVLERPAGGDPTVVDPQTFERSVNEHTLRSLRNYSLGALGVLFVASVGVGWTIAGRVLAPIDRIGNVTREIQATNLSRRIALQGPDDELKRLADTFDAMLARLDNAFAAQRRFVSDASHELRNPVTVIRSNAELVASDPAATGEIRRRARRVERASERMGQLVGDLLALARLEGPSSSAEPVDLSVVVREIGDEHVAVAAERSVRLDWAAPPALVVTGDRAGLKRAIANLLDNALGHAPPATTVRLRAGHGGAWAWVAVRDCGPGIPHEHQERIFRRFYRLDPARSRERGGSGLGLAIVREIVRAHAGVVRVRSSSGRGSLFVLWLPFERPDDVPPDGEPEAPPRRLHAGATAPGP